MAVRLHRRLPAHRLARRLGRARPARLRAHRARGRDLRSALEPGPRAVRPGDQPAGRLRGRRRPARVDEAGRLRRRRGRDVDLSGPPLPGDASDVDDLEELRGIELFTGLTDDQLTELAARRRRGRRSRHGDVLFTEGEHADEWWVLLAGSLDLVRKVGREDVVVARMDVPGAGPAASGRGTTTASTSRPAAGRRPGRVLRLDAPRLRELVNHWFPLAGHLIGGLHQHRPLDRVDGPSARRPGHPRHPGGRARPRDQQPRRRRQPHGRRPRASAVTPCSTPVPAGRDDITAAQFTALDALRREQPTSAPRQPRRRAGPRGPRGRSWPPGSTDTAYADAWITGGVPGRGWHRRRVVRARTRGAGRRRARPGSGVGLGDRVVQGPARRAEGRRPPHLRARGGRPVLLADGPRARPSASTSATGSRAPLTMLGHKLKGGVTVAARVRRHPADRRLRRASSTRSGPT